MSNSDELLKCRMNLSFESKINLFFSLWIIINKHELGVFVFIWVYLSKRLNMQGITTICDINGYDLLQIVKKSVEMNKLDHNLKSIQTK